jgi:nucleoside-diphosphate-sugar epimerase
MNSAIVAGANGFVGSAVVAHLVKQGIHVVSIGRRKRDNKSKSEIYLEIDMDNINSLEGELRRKNWDFEKSCVFYNFSWCGNLVLTDGTLDQQMKNVFNSVEAVKTAKQLGCSKFINCGTLEETFCEENLIALNSKYQLTQKNYVLAKLASRDFSKFTAYSNQIDYIHTRLSVPFSAGFTRNSYIENNLRLLTKKMPIEEPKNNNIFDLINVNDVADAYFKIGLQGKNLSDYFIGSDSPAKLQDYFIFLYEVIQKQPISTAKKIEADTLKIFDTSLLQEHTGYVPSASFKNYVKSL